MKITNKLKKHIKACVQDAFSSSIDENDEFRHFNSEQPGFWIKSDIKVYDLMCSFLNKINEKLDEIPI